MKDLDVTASKLINIYVVLCVCDQVKGSICDVIFVLKEKKGDNSTTTRVLKTIDRVLIIHGFYVFTLNK